MFMGDAITSKHSHNTWGEEEVARQPPFTTPPTLEWFMKDQQWLEVLPVSEADSSLRSCMKLFSSGLTFLSLLLSTYGFLFLFNMLSFLSGVGGLTFILGFILCAGLIAAPFQAINTFVVLPKISNALFKKHLTELKNKPAWQLLALGSVMVVVITGGSVATGAITVYKFNLVQERSLEAGELRKKLEHDEDNQWRVYDQHLKEHGPAFIGALKKRLRDNQMAFDAVIGSLDAQSKTTRSQRENEVLKLEEELKRARGEHRVLERTKKRLERSLTSGIEVADTGRKLKSMEVEYRKSMRRVDRVKKRLKLLETPVNTHEIEATLEGLKEQRGELVELREELEKRARISIPDPDGGDVGFEGKARGYEKALFDLEQDFARELVTITEICARSDVSSVSPLACQNIPTSQPERGVLAMPRYERYETKRGKREGLRARIQHLEKPITSNDLTQSLAQAVKALWMWMSSSENLSDEETAGLYRLLASFIPAIFVDVLNMLVGLLRVIFTHRDTIYLKTLLEAEAIEPDDLLKETLGKVDEDEPSSMGWQLELLKRQGILDAKREIESYWLYSLLMSISRQSSANNLADSVDSDRESGVSGWELSYPLTGKPHKLLRELEERERELTGVSTVARIINARTEPGWDRVKAIHDFVAHWLHYNADQNLKQEAEVVFITRQASCLGFSNLFAKLCSLCGVSCKVVKGYTDRGFLDDNQKTPNHAWNVIKTKQKRGLFKMFHVDMYHVDVTWNSPNQSIKTSYRTDWLAMPAHEFILTHVPSNKKYQGFETPLKNANLRALLQSQKKKKAAA